MCHSVVYGSVPPLGLQAGGSIAQELPAQHLPHPGFASGNLSAGGRALPGSNPATLLEATQPPWLLTQVWDLQQPEDHLNFVMQAKGLVARKHHREQKKNRLLQESESREKKKRKTTSRPAKVQLKHRHISFNPSPSSAGTAFDVAASVPKLCLCQATSPTVPCKMHFSALPWYLTARFCIHWQVYWPNTSIVASTQYHVAAQQGLSQTRQCHPDKVSWNGSKQTKGFTWSETKTRVFKGTLSHLQVSSGNFLFRALCA